VVSDNLYKIDKGRNAMIKMLFINIILLIGLCAAFCFAQDPGMPDSLIIDSISVPYDSAQFWSHTIPVYFVTDDSVEFIYMSLTWNSPDSQIFMGHNVWGYPFSSWDWVYDSIDIGHQQIIFTLFGGDGNPPIYTDSMRWRGLDLRIIIAPNAQRQLVFIDSVESI